MVSSPRKRTGKARVSTLWDADYLTCPQAGISWPIQELTSDPVAKFFQPGSKLDWHYNWNKNWDVLLPQTAPGLKIDAEFVPMIFAPEYLNNEYKLQNGYRMILGYNEPDYDAPTSVRRTPQEAAKAWVELAKLRTSIEIKLVSPGVAASLDWLKDFMAFLPDHSKPDYIAVHVYTTTFDSFKETVERYWRTFQLPIVVTEFAMTSFDPNVPPPQSQQQVHDFMGQTTKWLDETEYIIRYAWFGAVRDLSHLHGVHPYNRLMDQHGEITPLGWQYIQGGHE
ncbi:hypothetical protein BCR39DRAFT_346299 [Naematelia encephala]|uniref:Asl1-like glycosyl hydrolase catalytic domain-containing protein n=1 Tax=Naematelia encephala TaxID=71784 RepID=A0A1Y2AMU4_9TREE|nr:hypothetical protein BCR39DRAFT_346299 [Naematelia encephala]